MVGTSRNKTRDNPPLTIHFNSTEPRTGGTERRYRMFARRSELENVRRRLQFQRGTKAAGVFGQSYRAKQQNSRVGRGHGQRGSAVIYYNGKPDDVARGGL